MQDAGKVRNLSGILSQIQKTLYSTDKVYDPSLLYVRVELVDPGNPAVATVSQSWNSKELWNSTKPSVEYEAVHETSFNW